MDLVSSSLPPATGLLPFWMLFISVVSIGNSIQSYTTLRLTRRLYNGRFVRTATESEDSVRKLVPVAPVAPAPSVSTPTPPAPQKSDGSVDQVTPLAARCFGTWTVLTSILRCYAAYNLASGPFYDVALWSYVVAFAHFASELFVFRTMTFGLPQFFPFCVSISTMIWMVAARGHYVKIPNA